MKKVLLINPLVEGDVYSFSNPHIGLGYLGSALLSAGYEVKIFDMRLPGCDLSSLVVELNKYAPQTVGITGSTLQYPLMLKTAKLTKRVNGQIVTVFGGPHASALPRNILNEGKDVDYIICGEGERSFAILLDALNNKGDLGVIPGLVYRNNGQILSNSFKNITDLDNLEYPWKLINPLDYQKGRVHGFVCRKMPVAAVISSRGCPYQCTFCAARKVHGLKVRIRNHIKFVDELEYLKKNFGIKEIQIADDNFTFNREHAVAVCNEMIKRELNILWSLPNGVRADRLDRELLLLMKKAGCYYMSFGIEFGSERMLKICKKSLNLSKALANIKLASSLNFITSGFFLIGYPGEKPEDIELTKKFIKAAPFDKIFVGLAYPYPGSELLSDCINNGYCKPKDLNWKNCSINIHSTKVYNSIDKDYINKQKQRIFSLFYLNPVKLIRFVSKFRTCLQFKCALFGLFALLRSIQSSKETDELA